MRILVLGGSGFIGSAAVARLAREGFAVRAVSRGGDPSVLPQVEPVRFDMARARKAEDWSAVLDGVEAVVNCAGTLQDSPTDDVSGVHVTGVKTLIRACEQAQIRKFVHVSAIGIADKVLSGFSRTKLQGDEALMASSLDWVILRPSVVIGRAAYGGSALMRGLAALPVAIPLRKAGALQPVHLDDVVETVVACLRNGPQRAVLNLAGPRRYSMAETVAMFRQWLRLPPAHTMPLPDWTVRLLFRLGDLAGLLGWPAPVRSNALLEMRRGAAGDNSGWIKATGTTPRDIGAALAQEPASVQEQWFARLYLLKPAVFGVLGLFWIATGLVSFGPGWDHGMGLLREGGLGEAFSVLTLSAGALTDILIGLAILYRPTARYGLWAAIIISITYAVIGTLLVPRLWADPLGPMLKIWPVTVLNFVALAILKDR